MKRLKKLFFLCLMVFALILFASCSKKGGSLEEPSGDVSPSGSTDMWDGKESTSGNSHIQAGQMSAKEWSDLKNYDFWKSLFVSNQDSNEGQFYQYFLKGYFDSLNMVTVNVTNDNNKVQGAKVELKSANDKVLYTSITDALGNSYLFPKTNVLDEISKVTVSINQTTKDYEYKYDASNAVLAYDFGESSEAKKVVEIMFVIDTTGSMTDEINFLKAEIDYVISEAKALLEDVEIKLALLFYRDTSDVYTTRYYDFSTDIASLKVILNQQEANGGGDYEEAVDIALDEAVSKSWSSENTTKLLFHVLDAPPHYTQECMTRYQNAIDVASQKGIRIIPVASSGIDEYTEYLLRNEALLTGGTYTAITNHSGIGGDHIEPTIGETEVEYLNLLLIRLVVEYYTGIPQEKVVYNK